MLIIKYIVFPGLACALIGYLFNSFSLCIVLFSVSMHLIDMFGLMRKPTEKRI
jgi:hypothetical protein